MSRFFKKALKPIYYILGLLLFSSITLYIVLASSLPTVEELQDMKMQIPMRIYTQDKKLIAVYGEKKRIPVTFKEIPNDLKNAFIAAEDNRFYSHNGVDYFGLLRAFKSFISNCLNGVEQKIANRGNHFRSIFGVSSKACTMAVIVKYHPNITNPKLQG